MIITPVSDYSKYEAGGRFEPTAANFPALKHLFKCNEVTSASASTLTDSVGGVVLTVPTSLTNNADGTITLGGNATAIASGTWASPVGKKVLVLWAGKPSSGSFRVGNTTAGTGNGIAAASSGNNSMNTAQVSNTTIAAPKAADGTAGAWALAVAYGTTEGMTAYGFLTADATVTASATTDLTTAQPTATVFDAAVSCPASIVPAIISVWCFTTLPSAASIKAAVAWMTYQSMTTPYRKILPPWWRGMA